MLKYSLNRLQGWPDLVEAGELDANATKELLNSYLKPLITQGIDTLLLGCTHYPFVKPVIQEICGAGITIIDNGVAVAGQLVRILEERGLRENNRNKGEVIFYTSGFPQAVSKVVGKLWPEPVNRVIKVEL
ncbi:MAG: glutamate racemase [Bacteroidota bacterium]